MNASAVVNTPRRKPAAVMVRRRASRNRPAAAAIAGRRRVPVGDAGVGMSRTKHSNAATPAMAMKKLVTSTRSKACGSVARIANATSGPSSAPAVSSARWMPKAIPSRSGAALSEMSESRGEVRMPLPTRSNAIAADASPHAPPAASSAILQSAERP